MRLDDLKIIEAYFKGKIFTQGSVTTVNFDYQGYACAYGSQTSRMKHSHYENIFLRMQSSLYIDLALQRISPTIFGKKPQSETERLGLDPILYDLNILASDPQTAQHYLRIPAVVNIIKKYKVTSWEGSSVPLVIENGCFKFVIYSREYEKNPHLLTTLLDDLFILVKAAEERFKLQKPILEVSNQIQPLTPQTTSQDPVKIKAKIILWLATIALFLGSPILFGLFGMAFDAPDSEKDIFAWIMATSIFGYPFVAITVGWILYNLKSYSKAIMAALSPLAVYFLLLPLLAFLQALLSIFFKS